MASIPGSKTLIVPVVPRIRINAPSQASKPASVTTNDGILKRVNQKPLVFQALRGGPTIATVNAVITEDHRETPFGLAPAYARRDLRPKPGEQAAFHQNIIGAVTEINSDGMCVLVHS